MKNRERAEAYDDRSRGMTHQQRIDDLVHEFELFEKTVWDRAVEQTMRIVETWLKDLLKSLGLIETWGKDLLKSLGMLKGGK